MARSYRRDWRGRFAGGGGGGRGRPRGRVKEHGSRRMRRAGKVKALTQRQGRSVAVIQRDRSGRNRVRQTTVRRPLSRLPISRRRAIKVSAASTRRKLKRGEQRVIVRPNHRRTKIAKRNVYIVTGG